MPAKTNTEPLPFTPAPGVAPLSIPEVDKAVAKYERLKEKRCEASPGEIAAKQELKKILGDNRLKLPQNEDGLRFYRKDGVDYILEETLKRRADDEAGGEE